MMSAAAQVRRVSQHSQPRLLTPHHKLLTQAAQTTPQAHKCSKQALTLPVCVQLLVIFDADMVCSPEFFTKIVAELYDPQVALVLTPQVCSYLLLVLHVWQLQRLI